MGDAGNTGPVLSVPTRVISGEGADSRLALGDCLAWMAELPTASVDLIYVDPPFGTGREQRSGSQRGRAVTYSDVWEGGREEYLAWLRPRLAQMHRLLHRRGSLFLHLDWRAVHYAKVMLDEIFGEANFRNELIWHYGSGGRAKRFFHRKHDVILWYSRTGRWRFYGDAVAVPRNRCPVCGEPRAQWNHLKRHVDADGRVYRTIRSAGKVYRYYDDEPTVPADVWLDLAHLQQKDPERLGYPSQKPLALLRRIVGATTAEGHRVADFFCGSGTTPAAAAEAGRSFWGCDASPDAVALTAQRLADQGVPFALEHVGVLSVTRDQCRRPAAFRAAVRDWLGARQGPPRQRTIHGLLDGPGGPTPLWIAPPEGGDPITPAQVARFVAAVRRHTKHRQGLLLGWALPDAARRAARDEGARGGLALRLGELCWLTRATAAAPGLLQWRDG